MIALQEELDWDVYHRYGLLTDEQAAELIAAPASVPNLKLGQRAFEIVLARRVERGELEPSGSLGTARPRSPRSRRTGRKSTAASSSAGSRSSSPTATSA